MHAMQHVVDSKRYAKVIEVSKRIRWDIERDVIRGRRFDFGRKFLPDGLSRIGELPFRTLGRDRSRSSEGQAANGQFRRPPTGEERERDLPTPNNRCDPGRLITKEPPRWFV